MVTRPTNQSINQSNISFYGNVSDKTKETSQATLELVKQNVNLPEFFDGLEVKVGRNFSKINDDNVIAAESLGLLSDLTFGFCGFCNMGNDRECYISEFAHKYFDPINILKGLIIGKLRGAIIATIKEVCKKPDQEQLSCTIAHEVGHLYDDYLIQESSEARDALNNILSKENNNMEDEIYIQRYAQADGIADSKEFKDILYSDLENVDMKDLKCEVIEYFVNEFYNENNDNRPTRFQIEIGSYCRGEVFAQLFAYACGTDDGLKDFFTTKIFPNTYKFVQEFIKNPTELTMDNKITLPGEPLIFGENCIASVDTVPATTPEEQNIEVVEIKPVAKVEQSCIAPVDFLA